jgi:molybdenum cofactor cytidylyltransferase
VRGGRRKVSTAAIVLAAGESRRLGELKQLVRLNGERLLERAVRMCREAGCAPIVVVLGASAGEIREKCEFGSAQLVVNERWVEGMGPSLAAGVSALEDDVEGCLVLTCDQPAVSAAHLRELMKRGELLASSYAGRRGVPAFFPASRFAELIQLQGDAGAREMLKEACALPLPDGDLDIDTPEDLERARRLFSKRPE